MRDDKGRFKPGSKGNPHGSGAAPPEVREAKRLNKDTAIYLLTKCIYLTAQEIHARFNDPSTPAIELIMLKIIEQAVKHGDQRRLDFIFNRLIGRVPQDLNIEGGVKPMVMKLFGEDAAIVLQGAKNESHSGDRE